MQEVKIFAEFGIGNDTFCSTEIEKGSKEYRLKGFLLPPKIEAVYVRIWIGKIVFAISTKTISPK